MTITEIAATWESYVAYCAEQAPLCTQAEFEALPLEVRATRIFTGEL